MSLRRMGWNCAALGVLAVVAISMRRTAESAEETPPPQAAAATNAASTGNPLPAGKPASRLGRRVANFVLPDAAGKDVALADFQEQPVVILYCMGTGCPIANLYLPDLVELQKQPGVRVIGFNANPGDSAAEIAAHAQEYGLNFSVICDSQQTLAGMLGAERTAEVFVLDGRRTIRYRGRIDDRYQYTTRREKAEREDLREALRQLQAGEEITVPATEVAGCRLSPVPRPADAAAVTYAGEVARILQNRCQFCHHPGTAAPFSLLTYDDAVNWSAMLKEVVLEKRMPPWHADPRFQKFENDCRLSAAETAQLVAWVDAGTPRGNAADEPPPRAYVEGWRMGEPDVVFELPETVDVPATGTVPYRYFVTPTNFKEDMWISAAEVRPDQRQVVHHIVVFYQGPAEKQRNLERNWVVGAAPGDTPVQLPPGVGIKIPAGSKLIWQVHYTPNGNAAQDRSMIGLKFCKEPPRQIARVHGISNHRLEIPAGAARHEVRSQMTVPNDVLLLSLMPHMHLRGKSFEFRATYPDGRSEVLLSVPQFDFNWQATYRLAEPLKLPRGTRVDCTAHYDNSPQNPGNPDPKQEVRWGDQTWEEMMIGYLTYVVDEPAQ